MKIRRGASIERGFGGSALEETKILGVGGMTPTRGYLTVGWGKKGRVGERKRQGKKGIVAQ